MARALVLLFLPVLLSAADYDVLIRNARVIDGSGNPWYRADVAVKDGRIAAIGRLNTANAPRTIDARERVLATYVETGAIFDCMSLRRSSYRERMRCLEGPAGVTTDRQRRNDRDPLRDGEPQFASRAATGEIVDFCLWRLRAVRLECDRAARLAARDVGPCDEQREP